MASKKNGKENDEEEKIIKKVVSAYKYSAKGSSNLYEAIILGGQPCFVTWDDYANTVKIKESIEETTRIIRPPSAEEYPYTPYEFGDQDELTMSNDAFHNFDNTIKEEDNASPMPSAPSAPSAFPPKCYHCDFSIYETKEEYQYHCVLRHAGKPAYPGPADIKESGLTAQGMSWENATK